jgi:hypothetical protein
MPSGNRSWSVKDFRDSLFDLSIAPSGDESGNGGADVLFSRVQVTPTAIESRVDAIEGRTGARRWGVGVKLSPVAPPSAGSIAGAVVDSHGNAPPAGSVCVSAWNDQGFVTGSSTDAEGAFTLASLAAGDYRVFFEGCDFGTYASQWWDGKTSYDNADRVTVADGAATSGIDAVMLPFPPPEVTHVDTRAYVAGALGDVYDTGPLPNGLLNDCTADGPSAGGQCFAIGPDDDVASATITDDSGALIGGTYQVTSNEIPIPTVYDSGFFCGTIDGINVTGSADLWIFTSTTQTIACGTRGVPTSGTITATFGRYVDDGPKKPAP